MPGGTRNYSDDLKIRQLIERIRSMTREERKLLWEALAPDDETVWIPRLMSRRFEVGYDENYGSLFRIEAIFGNYELYIRMSKDSVSYTTVVNSSGIVSTVQIYPDECTWRSELLSGREPEVSSVLVCGMGGPLIAQPGRPSGRFSGSFV